MAKDDKDIDEEEDDLGLGNEKAPGRKKIIILIAAAFLLINAAIGGYVFLLAGDEEVAVDGEEEVVVEEDDGRPTFYHAIKDLVVNLEGKPSMLQVGLQIRVRGEDMAGFIAHNEPMIRHEFLNILAVQDGKALKKRANKEALQSELLKRLRHVAVDQGGPDDPEKSIEGIYFVAFVMQ